MAAKAKTPRTSDGAASAASGAPRTLCIDIGGTGIKTLVVGPDGQAADRAPPGGYAPARDAPGRSSKRSSTSRSSRAPLTASRSDFPASCGAASSRRRSTCTRAGSAWTSTGCSPGSSAGPSAPPTTPTSRASAPSAERESSSSSRWGPASAHRSSWTAASSRTSSSPTMPAGTRRPTRRSSATRRSRRPAGRSGTGACARRSRPSTRSSTTTASTSEAATPTEIRIDLPEKVRIVSNVEGLLGGIALWNGRGELLWRPLSPERRNPSPPTRSSSSARPATSPTRRSFRRCRTW